MLENYFYRGRHRAAPPTVRVTAARLAALGAVSAGATLAAAPPASAASDSTWDRLAQCESSGNWAINTGNGFSGGLQFVPSTWAGFGGREFAPAAHLATRAQQIVVAERVLAAQGWGAWPACSAKLGLHEGATQRSAPAPKPDPAPKPAPTPAPSSSYVVRAGDTLSGIAAARGTTWQALYADNRDVVENPNRIYPGERLRG